MEMVSAAKMRKAIDAVLKTRTYANLSWETILNITKSSAGNGQPLHPLLQKKDKVIKVAIVVITSNRGLCGGFNTAVINKVKDSIKKHHLRNGNQPIGAELVLIGRKGEALAGYGHEIVADFAKEDVITQVTEVIPVARMVTRDFIAGKYDKVMVAYTDFINAAKQTPRIKQLLPVEIGHEEEYLGIVGQDTRVGLDKKFISEKMDKHSKDDKFIYDYKFEPSAREVLDAMVPRLIEVQLFQALLESNASEHSARMTAMHQATEAANDMADELTLFYNKARQAGITRELAEISAGAVALEE
jgi:F-type H+-transporting ATPase subunit gamma